MIWLRVLEAKESAAAGRHSGEAWRGGVAGSIVGGGT